MAVRDNAPANGHNKSYVEFLAGLDRDQLANELNTDARKLAFWINVYNAFAQELLDPANSAGSMLATLFPWWVYQQRKVRIAGQRLSLNDMEHGILRRSRIWWSLWLRPGGGRKIWAGSFERRFRVDRPDPRIHFALNCAAVSCPPIRFYRAEQISEQLDRATAAYLEQTLDWNPTTQTLVLPAIFRMYPGDFGGAGGMLNFCNRYQDFIDPETKPKIVFQPFDKKARLRHFAVESAEQKSGEGQPPRVNADPVDAASSLAGTGKPHG